MKRILVPLDGSPSSELILERIEPMVRPGGQIVLLRAVPLPVQDIHVNLSVAERVAVADRYVQSVVERLTAASIDAKALAEFGNPAVSILRAAATEKVDLIAMCTSGRSEIARLALGSVAEEVLRRADVPVWLARPEQATPRAIHAILVPLDGSPLSDEAVPVAAGLAKQFGARIDLIHVFKKRKHPNELAQPPRPLDHATQLLRRDGFDVHPDFLEGDAADGILAAAADHSADLIVMESHGRTGLSRLVLGSVAEGVVRRAPVPVVVQRARPVREGVLHA